MIRGSLGDESGRRRPQVSAQVAIPAQSLAGEVTFLIDTGADSTLLAPADATRLGLDMARIASSPNATVDLDAPWEGRENLWLRLTAGPLSPVAATLDRLGYGPVIQFGPLLGYVHQSTTRPRIRIVRHPLWQDDHPGWVDARTATEQDYPGYQVMSANQFRLLRRPADYV